MTKNCSILEDADLLSANIKSKPHSSQLLHSVSHWKFIEKVVITSAIDSIYFFQLYTGIPQAFILEYNTYAYWLHCTCT